MPSKLSQGKEIKIILASLIASISAANALAGSLDTVALDSAPTAVAAQTFKENSWTGAYVGLQYGKGDAEASFGGISEETDGDAYGIPAVYLHDLGQYVVGGELSFDRLT